MRILELKNVYYAYGNKNQKVEVLKNVSCSFETGKIYAIVGKSGSGKSTMLSLMAGLDLPTSGQVLFEGVPTSQMDLDRYRRECVAVIYQNFRLFPLLTVSENITYPMELRGFKGEPARAKARELVRKVALPETVLDRFPGMLSGGEQQRVAIARALSIDTKLILADEPTGNLDEENSRNIIDILINLARNENYCVIMVTHDLSIIPRMDVVYRLSGGRLQLVQDFAD
ncbi:putative ABC transporter ATP-binding protein YclH [Thermoclostridium stercorarium subsp. stercorarium DSM 8532]|jgi:ABC-type lipoprotein export system ATPase subunit|uniref:ABC transporter ATP-binding protein n=3 Tax=Thermoclostridium stercorarium TaxID=1510 RepID=A0A1B1YPM2_THEST|nr:ABC transporter ATP-binding protein [Thermoclostridium stercorarium]AGC69678.1 putative ABC transporter ATP-binding protein YclH [Thermoclostridium stercorarium subsp. stercorarium DSM 8532]AGI40631.1 ABC transporter ATPase subunit [Thermoclostridium stercorarium subsp. stercorarium DSM 8532]ANX00087.1 ABC transporter ATP-binding protein [Thermoclostridium stercorarium subsp. thermolacticum DSM 2910]ANX02731.1 ABC transporter ATP-binding protein [Thermoclostridium stercorarium subsp. leptosp